MADDKFPDEPEEETPAPDPEPAGAPNDVQPKPIRPGLPVLD